MSYHAVIFDLDGTLADTVRDIRASVNHALARVNIEEASLDRVRESVGGGVSKLIENLVDNVPLRERVAGFFKEHYAEHLLDKTKLFPGAAKALAAISPLPMVLLSNKPEAMTKKIAEGLEIRRYFRVIYGGDSLPAKKPDPAVGRQVLKVLGTAAKDTLLVGDSRYDLETAANVNIPFCGVSWGYARTGELADAPLKITSFAELPAIVQGGA